MTTLEAANFLGTTERFVRRLIAERRLAVHRLGRHVRLAEADLVEFVEAGRSEAVNSSRRYVSTVSPSSGTGYSPPPPRKIKRDKGR